MSGTNRLEASSGTPLLYIRLERLIFRHLWSWFTVFAEIAWESKQQRRFLPAHQTSILNYDSVAIPKTVLLVFFLFHSYSLGKAIWEFNRAAINSVISKFTNELERNETGMFLLVDHKVHHLFMNSICCLISAWHADYVVNLVLWTHHITLNSM